MKLHELEVLHEDLIDITIGKKTFVLTENDKNYQEGDLIRFIDLTGRKLNNIYKIGVEPYINENTLYRISYVLKNVKNGLNEKYCILSIKQLVLLLKLQFLEIVL